MAELEYPKRPPFYANKLTRLLFKTATANHAGADMCYLVTQIAHQEDAARYAGAVTFWNEQLMAICGFKSVRALDRAREKAVKAGWLIYQKGGKGLVGKYWTTVPPQYANMPDGPMDESGVHAELFVADGVNRCLATETPDKRQTNAEEPPHNSQRTAEEQPEKCLTFLPNPIPDPSPNSVTGSEVEVPPSKPTPTAKVKPERLYPEPPAETAITFECSGRTAVWHLVTPQIDVWQQLYPALDVPQECRQAKAWILANQKNRKTADGMMKFLVGWLNRAQNQGGSNNGNNYGRGGTRGTPAIGDGQRFNAEAAAKRGVHDF